MIFIARACEPAAEHVHHELIGFHTGRGCKPLMTSAIVPMTGALDAINFTS